MVHLMQSTLKSLNILMNICASDRFLKGLQIPNERKAKWKNIEKNPL